MERKREGSGRQRKPATKTRRKLLSWYYTDCPGSTLVHSLWLETEVVIVCEATETSEGLSGRLVPGARETAPLEEQQAVPEVQPPVVAGPPDCGVDDTQGDLFEAAASFYAAKEEASCDD